MASSHQMQTFLKLRKYVVKVYVIIAKELLLFIIMTQTPRSHHTLCIGTSSYVKETPAHLVCQPTNMQFIAGIILAETAKIQKGKCGLVVVVVK